MGSSPRGVPLRNPEVEVSSSFGGMFSGDVKAFHALEVIRSSHSSDSVMNEELLRLVRGRYSISSDYELHASQPEQHPFDLSLTAQEVTVQEARGAKEGRLGTKSPPGKEPAKATVPSATHD
ncbi:hypothetical protein B296_00004616 [Ensete ventricosum]|uniref:Uncharacterized protein n=1 Tax=Ensete ventricosum TaxID=4639 RepID=A0A426Y702_ENSVE|nr:hypothetical protein B296_00004616 [Ensete ventricosum]